MAMGHVQAHTQISTGSCTEVHSSSSEGQGHLGMVILVNGSPGTWPPEVKISPTLRRTLALPSWTSNRPLICREVLLFAMPSR